MGQWMCAGGFLDGKDTFEHFLRSAAYEVY